jgi:hypothetical protein
MFVFFHLNSGLTHSVSGGICGINIISEEEVVVLPQRGLKATSRTSQAVLRPSQAAVTALALQWLGFGLKWL